MSRATTGSKHCRASKAPGNRPTRYQEVGTDGSRKPGKASKDVVYIFPLSAQFTSTGIELRSPKAVRILPLMLSGEECDLLASAMA